MERKQNFLAMRNVGVLVFLLTLLGAGVIQAESELAKTVPSDFLSVFSATRTKLGLPQGEGIKFARESELTKGRVWSLGNDSLRMHILISSKEINYLVIKQEEKLLEEWREKNPGEVQPRLTFEEAKKISRNFVKNVRGEYPDNMFPEGGFDSSSSHSKGAWRIWWSKMEDGYKYPNDWVFTRINDSTGRVIRYGTKFHSEKCIIPEHKISESEAVEKAKKAAERAFSSKWCSFHKEVGYKLAKVPSSVVLQIVNPNNVFIKMPVLIFPTASRLAYEARFDLTGEKLGKREILIWIDAETGNLLGGDF